MSGYITTFRDWGQPLFRAQYHSGARIVSRVFISHEDAQSWLDDHIGGSRDFSRVAGLDYGPARSDYPASGKLYRPKQKNNPVLAVRTKRA